MRSILIFFSFCLFSCSDSALQQELGSLKSELQTAKETITNLESQLNQEDKGEIEHLVFLKVRPDADRDALISEIKKLEGIEVVQDLEVGLFEDLGDPRALSEYSVAFEVSFKDSLAYQTYQVHPLHQALKENTKEMLAGPPATYDFVKN